MRIVYIPKMYNLVIKLYIENYKKSKIRLKFYLQKTS